MAGPRPAQPIRAGDQLKQALGKIEREWSLPSTFTLTGVHHGYSRITLVNAGYWWPTAEPFRQVLETFAPVYEAFLSRLAPGGFIIPHRDGHPWYERWHTPIHAAGLFDSERPEDGKPFRVQHWQPHAVWNDTDRPRIHLVIDRDIPIDLDPLPFETFPIPAKHAAMVARVKE